MIQLDPIQISLQVYLDEVSLDDAGRCSNPTSYHPRRNQEWIYLLDQLEGMR